MNDPGMIPANREPKDIQDIARGAFGKMSAGHERINTQTPMMITRVLRSSKRNASEP